MQSDKIEVKRILILGHTGFVGNRLLKYFKQKYPDLEIIGKSSKDIDLTNYHDALKLKDLFDTNTVVIMCSGIKSNYGDDLDCCIKNIRMAENICKVLTDYPVNKFLFFSSIAVYGVNTNNVKITEKTHIKNDTYYGLSKSVSEGLLSLHFAKSRNSLIILRTPTIYGPGEKILAPTPSGFLNTYLDGKEVTLWGDGSEIREFLYVDDLIRIIDELLNKNISGVLNIADGMNHTYKESLDLISKILNQKITIHFRERTKEKVNKAYNTSHFRSLFPDFKFTSLEDGLRFILKAHQQDYTNKNCHLCQRKMVKELFNLGQQPIANHFLKLEEKEVTFHLTFGQCQSCGLAQLIKAPPTEELVPKYKWINYTEPEEHLDSLAMKIKNLNPKKILGISYKDESLIKRLNKFGFSGKVLTKEDLSLNLDGVETVQAMLNPKKAKEIVAKYGKFDVVIARHILEHCYNMDQFIKAVKELTNPKGYVVFEVPDNTRAFNNYEYPVIWEEHLIYFTPTTFKQLFQYFDLKLEHFENYPYSLENSLIGIGKKAENIKNYFMSEAKLREEKKLLENFAKNFEDTKSSFKKHLAKLLEKNEKITLLGAGHLACAFLNYYELKDYFECIIDDDPNKIGLLMPGSKLEILSSKILLEKNIKLCLLSVNPANENKVLIKNQEFINSGGKFYSIFSGSDNSFLLTSSKDAIPQNLKKVSDEVFISNDKIVKMDQSFLDFIKKQSQRNSKKRARICFHQDINDPIHEMIISAFREGYIRPHKHLNKSESFHLIEGEMDVIIFDEIGNIKEIIKMSKDNNFYYRSPKNTFHTIIIKSKHAIFHETTNGPFDKEETVFAPWSPKEEDKEEIINFNKKMMDFKKND